MVSYEIAASAITTAPPEAIFAVLDDFGRWPEWMPAFQNLRVDLPSPGQPGPGYRFHLRGGLIDTELEVIDYSPLSRSTSFRVNLPPFTGTNSCRVVPLPEGRYRIERVDSLNMPGLLANLIDATQRHRFERLAADFLRALKATVEAGSGSPPDRRG